MEGTQQGLPHVKTSRRYRDHVVNMSSGCREIETTPSLHVLDTTWATLFQIGGGSILYSSLQQRMIARASKYDVRGNAVT